MIKVNSIGVGFYLLQGLQNTFYHCYHIPILWAIFHMSFFSDSLRAFIKVGCTGSTARPPVFSF